jgi:hypothetical protein
MNKIKDWIEDHQEDTIGILRFSDKIYNIDFVR